MGQTRTLLLLIKIKEFVEWEILKAYFNAVMDPTVDLSVGSGRIFLATVWFGH